MSSAREMRLRIRSVKSISQVTRALEAVSASKVRKAVAAVTATRAYARKAWQVLTHVAGQPGRDSLHPLLTKRAEIRNTLVVVITGDRGLAGAYNTNVIRYVARKFDRYEHPVHYVAVGRKGRDLMFRRGKTVVAEFSNLPAAPAFADVSSIGRIVVEEFLGGRADEVYLVYTDYVSMVRQETVAKRLLPLEVDGGERVETFEHHNGVPAAYVYEPGETEILDEIIPRFTALQVYQAVLESQASEHAARMVAMRNATDSALDLAEQLKLAYNKVRQQTITNDILDIVGGANALTQ
ncbi:MAG: ATP synthase gamma chain [Anaerolineaceae bacterium]|jgi:F-type H+-transporting ATPase subunit gamma|nr:ATP synthase F1 subunit gamma [Anaerolineae bacterium]MBL1171237.1 ATP synthase F1 subunit gamma [Chloroflexota bacterium]MBV6465367.1 ATP synthase gamma chain [Anaerolineales bacterium]MCE7905335.1 ATP synthase F1 subunit gamma [Anaerolineae bacterium CFX3]MDL1925516.1 ATP synthase F1 subunit gamma [Anaerolineae bacterium AMX1]OQY84414.1 MAG: ATP synthase F1 subunit gamma [Anaerolineae bacterium UTCFX3]GER80889.1 F0F1 ATP synthase F1 subunit gamma [Candidatus Denitrolinea symbiosum]GJQ38